MPLHPAAPEGLDGLAAAYAHTVQAISDLGHSLRPGDEERPTACPGWTVRDQFAHVVSLEAWVQGEDVPDADLPDGAPAEGVNHVVERFLESRRGRSLAELLEELDGLVADQVHHLHADTTSPDEPRIEVIADCARLSLTAVLVPVMTDAPLTVVVVVASSRAP